MGEYADDALDREINEWINPENYGDEFTEDYNPIYKSIYKTCKYCKKSGLIWNEFYPHRWKLFDPITRSIHSCIKLTLNTDP